MLVASLCRQVQSAGGFAAVLRHGDDRAGAVVVEWVDRGTRYLLVERATDVDGLSVWRSVGRAADTSTDHQAVIEKRVQSDPDLWVVELDIANAERFIDAIVG